jgi:hypothetical protein
MLWTHHPQRSIMTCGVTVESDFAREQVNRYDPLVRTAPPIPPQTCKVKNDLWNSYTIPSIGLVNTLLRYNIF